MPYSLKGLTSKEAKKLLKKFGPNVLPEKTPPSDLKIFLSQVKSPLVYILLTAGVVTFFLGHYSDTAIIGLAVFINTILGYLQERRASYALWALKELLHPQATVIRDSVRKNISLEEVV